MKIFERDDIEIAFSRALTAVKEKELEAKELGAIFGSLSIALASRMHQLKAGKVASGNSTGELQKLNEASACLTAKINTATVREMSQEILAAYKAYAKHH